MRFVVPLEYTALREAEKVTVGTGIAAFITLIEIVDPLLTRKPSDTVKVKLSFQTYPSAGV